MTDQIFSGIMLAAWLFSSVRMYRAIAFDFDPWDRKLLSGIASAVVGLALTIIATVFLGLAFALICIAAGYGP